MAGFFTSTWSIHESNLNLLGLQLSYMTDWPPSDPRILCAVMCWEANTGWHKLQVATYLSCLVPPVRRKKEMPLKVKEDEERRYDVWKWTFLSWHVIFQADSQEKCSETCWGKPGLPTQTTIRYMPKNPFELLTWAVWLFETDGPAAGIKLTRFS